MIVVYLCMIAMLVFIIDNYVRMIANSVGMIAI